MQQPTVARASRYGERTHFTSHADADADADADTDTSEARKRNQKQLTNGVAIQSSVMWEED
jgi:hypothetical protein